MRSKSDGVAKEKGQQEVMQHEKWQQEEQQKEKADDFFSRAVASAVARGRPADKRLLCVAWQDLVL